MPRYWLIAPVESKKPELFGKVWQFDLANNLISIGWSELGGISKMTREALSEAAYAAYPEKPAQTKALIANMLWAFYHEISPGDLVIARRGRKMLAAVGKVIEPATYSPGKTPTRHLPTIPIRIFCRSSGSRNLVTWCFPISFFQCKRLPRFRTINSEVCSKGAGW